MTTVKTKHPSAQKVLDELGRQMPFLLRAALDESQVPLEERMGSLEEIVGRLRNVHGADENWMPEAVKSYVVLCLEFLKLQKLLDKTGRYFMSSEREAAEKVYLNEDVFGGYYLPGMLLTEAIWPNHHKFAVLFKDHFLPMLNSQLKVAEVGVGSGFHLNHLYTAHPQIDYTGYDISDYAIEFGQNYAFGKVGAQPRASFEKVNITAGPPCPEGTYDALMLGEVLEHVEDATGLLKIMNQMAKPGAPFYMTTAIWAANIDHIYLFESAQDVRDVIKAAGWELEVEWVLPLYPKDKPEDKRVPINYGSILRKPK